jgi:hypothetical protein
MNDAEFKEMMANLEPRELELVLPYFITEETGSPVLVTLALDDFRNAVFSSNRWGIQGTKIRVLKALKGVTGNKINFGCHDAEPVQYNIKKARVPVFLDAADLPESAKEGDVALVPRTLNGNDGLFWFRDKKWNGPSTHVETWR